MCCLSSEILAAIVLARWLAVQATRWSIRDVDRRETSILFLMFPRGLITAVLALQVLAARGQAFFYVPAMAFTVVLFTNLFVVLAAVRSKPGLAGLAPSEEGAPSLVGAPTPEPELPA